MTTVEDITDALARLPAEDLARVRAWLDARAEAEWDSRIEEDARAGRLDALAAKALAEHQAGRTRPL